jgi:RNA polymerase sigma-70 factor (ECF subfamily)
MDFSTREAANVLGITESVLRHRLAAARHAMEERYEGLCALVNKNGICHQCKGLSEVAAMTGGERPEIPTIENLADRMAIVREIAGTPGRRNSQCIHDVFWRRTKEIEAQGLGATEPLSGCGEGEDPA